jgi:hypothetical protein
MNDFNIFEDMKSQIEKEHIEKIADLNARIDEIKSYTRQTLATSIVKISKEAKVQVLNCLGGKPVEPKELHALLKLKADADEFESVTKTKADKSDFDETTSVIEVLHNQLSQVCLILKDYFKLKTENSTKDEGLMRKKYHQVCTVSNWINTNEKSRRLMHKRHNSLSNDMNEGLTDKLRFK